jgi:hypothetical protein
MCHSFLYRCASPSLTFTSFNLTSSRLTSSAMTLFDQFSDLAGKFAPSKSSGLRGGGIGSGHGMVPIDDVSDRIISESSPSYVNVSTGNAGSTGLFV